MLNETSLPEPQTRQLSQMLAGIVAGGSGELSIGVERKRVRWLTPIVTIHNPIEMRCQPQDADKPNSLEEMIGPRLWPTFVSMLRDLIGHGYGRMTICVEHHQVQSLRYAPSVAAVDRRHLIAQ